MGYVLGGYQKMTAVSAIGGRPTRYNSVTCLAWQVDEERPSLHVNREENDPIWGQSETRNVLVVLKRQRVRCVLNKVEHRHAVAHRRQSVCAHGSKGGV
jgi:hypothetical protein